MITWVRGYDAEGLARLTGNWGDKWVEEFGDSSPPLVHLYSYNEEVGAIFGTVLQVLAESESELAVRKRMFEDLILKN